MTKQQRIIIYLGMLLMPLSGIGIDIYMPSMPHIQAFFQGTSTLVKLTISMFILGAAFGQFTFGVLSDSAGRKIIILICTAIFSVASFCATLSPSLHVLMLIRFCEGLVAGGISAVAKAMVPDVFTKAHQSKALTYLVTAWSLGPIIAPFLGGYLQHLFNWYGPFYFLASFSCLIFLLSVFFLPETNTHKQALSVKSLMHNIGVVIRNWHIWRAGICGGLVVGYIYSYNVASPFIFQTDLNYTAIEFGYFALCFGIMWMFGIMISRRFSHVGRGVLIRRSTWVLLVYTLIAVLIAYHFGMQTWVALVPFGILLLLVGIPFVNFMAIGVGSCPEYPGASSAIVSLLFVATGFLMTVIVSFINLHLLWPIFTFFFIMAIVIKLLVMIGRPVQ